MNQDKILILLAAYNGQAYLPQQLDSLLCQDLPGLQIVVSDDGSEDETLSILDRYAHIWPDKVLHYRSGQRFGCAQKHFFHLLEQFHDADYILFCDQDDVWHPDKVNKTLALMKQTETPARLPALVHTDLRVVNADLEELSPSFCAFSRLKGDRLSLNHLLVQNVVTGCTVMLNRPLAQLACRCESAEGMIMHDWWLALLASACGKIAFLPEPTVDYRQHGRNAVGAKQVSSPGYLLSRLRSKPMRASLKQASRQAAGFLAGYAPFLPEEKAALLQAFASTGEQGLLRRNLTYGKHRLLKYGAARKCAQFLGL